MKRPVRFLNVTPPHMADKMIWISCNKMKILSLFPTFSVALTPAGMFVGCLYAEEHEKKQQK